MKRFFSLLFLIDQIQRKQRKGIGLTGMDKVGIKENISKTEWKRGRGVQNPRCPAAVKGTNVQRALRVKPLGYYHSGKADK